MNQKKEKKKQKKHTTTQTKRYFVAVEKFSFQLLFGKSRVFFQPPPKTKNQKNSICTCTCTCTTIRKGIAHLFGMFCKHSISLEQTGRRGRDVTIPFASHRYDRVDRAVRNYATF